MRISHFDALRPICPVCKFRGLTEPFPLKISSVASEFDSQIVEGLLVCSNPACQSEFPILDGVPILLPNLRSYISANIFHLIARNDLSPITESLLGDCCSQGSLLDSMKQHLSCYTWGHYSDLDPQESSGELTGGSILRILEQGMELETNFNESNLDSSESKSSLDGACSVGAGPTLDIGCGPGRTTFNIAEKTAALTLGIDLNFSMLRLASTILREQRVTYPRRRIGVVYDRREFEVHFRKSEFVDFWACDALTLPFADGVFARAVGMNVLDSVSQPSVLLNSIARILVNNGGTVLACPYDWTASVTPIEEWVGGHSQRGDYAGACEPSLRQLLSNTHGIGEQTEPQLQLISELDKLPWVVRLHDRNSMLYRVHVVYARSRWPHANLA